MVTRKFWENKSREISELSKLTFKKYANWRHKKVPTLDRVREDRLEQNNKNIDPVEVPQRFWEMMDNQEVSAE